VFCQDKSLEPVVGASQSDTRDRQSVAHAIYKPRLLTTPNHGAISFTSHFARVAAETTTTTTYVRTTRAVVLGRSPDTAWHRMAPRSMIKADQRPSPRQASCLLAFLASLTSFLLYNYLLRLRSRSPWGYQCAQGDKSRMSDTQTRKEALVFQRHGFSISGERFDARDWLNRM
jgi:hypothetical protein